MDFRGWLFVGIGAIAIAIGGVLTTKGWNLLNVSRQKKNLIRSMAQEWIMNGISLGKPPISRATDGKKPGRKIMYPTLRTSALSNLIASGIFQFGHSKEGKLLLRAVNYQTSLVTSNNEFNIINGELNKSSTSDKITEIYHTQIIESGWFKSFKQQHELMRQLLREHYRWSLTEVSKK